MGLLDLLLDDDTTRANRFARTISPASPSSPIEAMDGDEGGDGDTVRAQVSADRKIDRSEQVRSSSFPHCPKCFSFALYRPNNAPGCEYECQTCGLEGIAEDVARRTQ
jgi:predicted RNA-binding Zn-ribbon protein involved in translation (DUF1610 family)